MEGIFILNHVWLVYYINSNIILNTSLSFTCHVATHSNSTVAALDAFFLHPHLASFVFLVSLCLFSRQFDLLSVVSLPLVQMAVAAENQPQEKVKRRKFVIACF